MTGLDRRFGTAQRIGQRSVGPKMIEERIIWMVSKVLQILRFFISFYAALCRKLAGHYQ